MILVKRDQVTPEIVSLCFNRPEKRNALNTEMIEQMIDHLIFIERNHQSKVIIIEGEGEDFCSGGDVSNMKRHHDVFEGTPWNIAEKYKHSFQRLTKVLLEMSCFTIAKIQGRAIGAGLGIAMHCDLRIACEKSSINAGFFSLGLIPGDGSMWRLTRILGPAKVNEFVLLKKTLTALEAKEWGLVSEVIPSEQLSERSFEVAGQLSKSGREVIQSYKASLRAADTMSLDDYLLLLRNMQSHLHTTSYHQCQF
ncbi:MAG: enoyl-CoA hydratase/isomerase family protein [Bacteriovoracaceae bacterium]|nr:enoyl-CoA hydratase/isomerase family protein [Bacteriovoracaceae bacterium]